MRFLLILCALASAGLVSGPADARLPDLSVRKERAERRVEQREQRREERRDEQRRDDRREEQHQHYTPRRDRSAEAALRAQRLNGGGRVLSVEPDRAGYRVKVLKDGEVRVHHVEDEH